MCIGVRCEINIQLMDPGFSLDSEGDRVNTRVTV